MLGTGHTGTCSYHSKGENIKCLEQDILGPVATAVKGRKFFIIFQNAWNRTYWDL
jgi:hypothetical protein